MLAFYGIPEKFEEMKEWYDGYDFGGTEIYNPWSVIRYIDNNCKPMCYWANTSDNKLAAESLIYAGKENKDLLKNLLNGGTVEKTVDTNLVFPEIKGNKDAIFSLLAQSGYLKGTESRESSDGYRCKLKVPNQEISSLFANEIMKRLLSNYDIIESGRDFMDAIIYGEPPIISK